jgi:hypothetical protein
VGKWVNDVLEATKEAEAPSDYLYWSALCAISAVVKRNVWLDMQYFKQFANIFVFLTGPSGLKKSFGIMVANNLVTEVGCTRVFDGQFSIEGMITSLGTAESKPDGTVQTQAAAFIASEEIAGMLTKNEDNYTYLIPLYDANYKNKWNKTLKGTGTETLKEPYLVMLGAIADEHFNNKMSGVEMAGGFIARTMLIHETQGGKPNSLLRPLEKKFDYKALVPGLKEISKLAGPMVIEEDAIVFHEAWYNQYKPGKSGDKTGLANRIQAHIIKVAMLLALSDKSLTIRLDHMQEAMDKVFQRAGEIHKVMRGAGLSKNAESTKKLITMLLSKPEYKMTRKEIIGEYYLDFDSVSLTEIVNTLKDGKIINEEVDGSDITYRLPESFVQAYLHGMRNAGQNQS